MEWERDFEHCSNLFVICRVDGEVIMITFVDQLFETIAIDVTSTIDLLSLVVCAIQRNSLIELLWISDNTSVSSISLFDRHRYLCAFCDKPLNPFGSRCSPGNNQSYPQNIPRPKINPARIPICWSKKAHHSVDLSLVSHPYIFPKTPSHGVQPLLVVRQKKKELDDLALWWW